jgi:SAM-dependent methyltransferase
MSQFKAIDFAGRRFNTVLDNQQRENHKKVVKLLTMFSPEMMSRKIVEANVQQAFILNTVLALTENIENAKMLCVGCFEDTAYEALKKMGYNVIGIDPSVDKRDLSTFLKENQGQVGTFDTIFSTSVIEHVPDDETFVNEISVLLKQGGVATLTCDYKNSWKKGEKLPVTDVRFYTADDLRTRLLSHMPGCELVDDGDWESFNPDFTFEGCNYSFASFTVRKTS